MNAGSAAEETAAPLPQPRQSTEWSHFVVALGLLLAMSHCDVLVIGGGLRGMHATLRARNVRPKAAVRCLEARAAPGDDVCSQLSDGHICELGPFAFRREEVERWLEPLTYTPRVVPASDRASTGWLFDGAARSPIDAASAPYSFLSGCAEIVQAYRCELGADLSLQSPVTAIAPLPQGGFCVELGVATPSTLTTAELVLAIAPVEAAKLLASFEPELPQVAARATESERAFVYFGGPAARAPELSGYGVLPHPDLESCLAELIFCAEVFDHCAPPGRFLIRAEVAASSLTEDDRVLAATAEAEVRRWTETRAPFDFAKVHRFRTIEPCGDVTECRTRVDEISRRAHGMSASSD